MTSKLTIVVNGSQRKFDYGNLDSHAAAVALSDVSSRSGRGIKLGDLIGSDGDGAESLTVSASSDGYSANLPLIEACNAGFVWFAGDDGPLTAEQGGPFRFLIPNAAECKTAVLDQCANVKHVDRIEIGSTVLDQGDAGESG